MYTYFQFGLWCHNIWMRIKDLKVSLRVCWVVWVLCIVREK